MSGVFESLSLLVPVVSETNSLIETVETILRVCDKQDIKEIIICPAHFASQESKDIAEALCEKHADVPVTLLMQNGNFEDFIKEMFRVVSGSHFMIHPSDLEENPNVVPLFIRESKMNPEAIVTGSRFLSRTGPKEYSKVKRFVFFFFRRIFWIVYNRRLTDSTFFYRIIPSKRVKGLVLTQKSFSILYEAFLKMLLTDTEVVEIPIEYKKRSSGKTQVHLFKDGFKYLKVFLFVRLSDKSKFYDSSPSISEIDS